MSAAQAVAVARSHGVILMALGGASLVAIGYVGVVAAAAPNLEMMWRLLAVFAAAAVSSTPRLCADLRSGARASCR